MASEYHSDLPHSNGGRLRLLASGEAKAMEANMPKAAQLLMNDGETLLDVCLNLHTSNTGSSDPLSEVEYERNLNILRVAVVNWDDTVIRQSRDFDAAVLNLVKKTIFETEAVMRDRA